ncbi:MAG: S8 family serine peptidase [Gemmatimonadales bacterium]
MNLRLAACLIAALFAGAALATAQDPRYAPGRVIVLAEPNSIIMPQGLTRVPTDQAQVRVARLREILVRRGVSAIRRAAPHWDDLRRTATEARVYARRKNELMPPDALADLSLLYVLESPDSVDVPSLAAELTAAEGVVYAEPDYLIQSLQLREAAAASADAAATLTPNDPLYVQGLNWGFNGTWGVNAPIAWGIQAGRSTTKIAIFDTGIETTHPDFGGGSRIAAQYDFVNGDANAYPDLDQRSPFHGLAVTGVAAAQSNDGFGSAGLCGGFAPGNSGCSILAGKILGSLSIVQLATEWLGLTSIVGDATSWAISNGANVINNSWCNSSVNRSVHDAFRNAYLSRVLVTAAMGNTVGDCGQSQPTTQVAPAAFADILMAVGATDEGGNRISRALGYNWESGVGPHIAVVAPGVNHHSDSLGGRTSWFGGTSEATPFVSGLGGLLYSEAAAKGFQFTAWDVRQLILNTARQKSPILPGWNDQTGWGIIDAGKALQVLQSPNQLTLATIEAIPGATCYSRTGQMNWTFWASWVVYVANRCEVRNAVTFAKRYATPPIVWGRPVSGGGVTPSNPNSEIFFTGVVPGSITATSATIRTYVYELWDLQGHYLGWWPAAPNQVGFGYAVLGQVAPFVVTASAPGLVTVKSTYSLTGSASDPATGWLWQQSYDGGPWGFWSSNQNSAFVAYAGTYTLDWRLSANRNFDSARDTGYATTRVCIPYSPTTCYDAAPPIMTAANSTPASNGGASSPLTLSSQSSRGLHFGSGLWIGLDGPGGGTAVRFYSFSGRHPTSTPAGEWPNLLEKDSVSWTAPPATGGPLLRVASRRSNAGEGVQIHQVTGNLVGWGPRRTITVGLAVDPDLGDPADDVLGFDTDLSLAWVKGDDSTYVGYLVLGDSVSGNVRARQFGGALGDEPEQGAEAYRLMLDSTQVDTSASQDVRFLLTLTGVPVTPQGRFVTAFAVVPAPSLAKLRDLAVATRVRQGELLAGLAADDIPLGEAPGFGLRQSLTHSVNARLSGEGTGSPVDTRTALRMDGITALDFSVPSGRDADVTIRIYNSSGQLVRILFHQRVSGGQFHVEWDRQNERGQRVSPGVYVAVMEAGSFRARRKLVVTR